MRWGLGFVGGSLGGSLLAEFLEGAVELVETISQFLDHPIKVGDQSLLKCDLHFEVHYPVFHV